MTTRTGEPATKRESYTQYIQGRAAAVRSTPTRVSTTALSPRVCFARRVLRTPCLQSTRAPRRPAAGR